MTQSQAWREFHGQARGVSFRDQVIALVCDRCDRDLVYVRIRALQAIGWVSRWFGCDCLDREPMSMSHSHKIIDGILGSGRSGLASCRTVDDVRIEVWGEAS